MTTIREIDQKCSVCGETSPQKMLSSTSTWGYPDLDLRPAEMQRSSMFAWLQECPHCGYVAYNIEDELEISSEILKSEAYITCDGYDFKGDMTKIFYRKYLIDKESGNVPGCLVNLQRCAWKCDDYEDPLACEMRKLALKYIDKTIAKSDNVKEKNNLQLIKADLLRRSGQFDEIIDEFKDLILGDLKLDEIIQFQILKAQQKDTSCYTGKDVFEK